MKVIALANQKGGVGKTTTCINLTAALAAMKKRVLMIDLDPQGSATVGSGIAKNELQYTANEILLNQCNLRDAIHKTEWRYDVVGANGNLTVAEISLITESDRQLRLKQALASVSDDYDYVLLDCPPSLNVLTLNALVAADSVLIPIQCEYYALEGLTSLLGTIEQIRLSANPELQIEGLVRTMYDARNRLTIEVSNQLLNHFDKKVYQAVIPRNVRLAEAPSHGLPVICYDLKSLGATSYLTLAGEFLRRQKWKSNQSETDQAVMTE